MPLSTRHTTEKWLRVIEAYLKEKGVPTAVIEKVTDDDDEGMLALDTFIASATREELKKLEEPLAPCA